LDFPGLSDSGVENRNLEILFQQLDDVQDAQLPALKIDPVGLGMF
jgi:hypothetical protein